MPNVWHFEALLTNLTRTAKRNPLELTTQHTQKMTTVIIIRPCSSSCALKSGFNLNPQKSHVQQVGHVLRAPITK
jgi:hypothetical protein